jgi:ketosteroid isomerase-like protein
VFVLERPRATNTNHDLVVTMQDDRQEVADANESFYRAFESLDIARMEAVWAKDAEIQCGHPGWRILRGWGPVMQSWRRIFENTPSMKFTVTDLKIEVRGDLAWVTLYENLSSSIEGQNYSAAILTTNIFQKSGEGWRMILHHGSSVSQPPDQDESSTVH